MKKLVLFCFLSIVSMLNLAFAQTHLGFWLENANPNSPEETYSLNAPVYGNEDVYYFHIDTACLDLGSCDEKLSIDWEIWRDGEKLDGTLSQFAHVYIEPFITDFQAGHCTNCPGVNPGWLTTEQLRTGSGLTSQMDYPARTDFPGALTGVQIPGFENGQGYWTMGSQSYNYLYLHYLLYASENNYLRLRIDWEQVGDYQLKFKLVRRTGGTDIENYYNHQGGQDLFYGGHSATACDDCVIAEVTIEELYRSSFTDEICGGDVYEYGMPVQTFTSNPAWPEVDTILADVPFYHNEDCRGAVCDSVVALTLIVHPIPPVATAQNQDVCGATNVTLDVTNVTENVTYEWYINLEDEAPAFVGNSYTTDNIVNDDTTYNYYIVAVSNEGCRSEAATVSVTTHPFPVVTLPAVANVFPMNQLVEVSATIEEGTYTDPVTYVWTGAEATTPGFAEVTIADTCGSYAYSVVVTDSWGCVSNVATNVVVAEDTEAPVVTENVDLSIEGCGSTLVPAVFASVDEIIEAGYEISDNSGASHTYFTQYFTLAFDREEEVEDCNYKVIRYYILEDRCGNQTGFTHTITITDTQAPTFSAVETGFVYTAETQANCTYVVPENIIATLLEDANVADNCTDVADLNIALYRANVVVPSADAEVGESESVLDGAEVNAGDEITENTEFFMVVTDACGNEVAINFAVVLPEFLTATIVAAEEFEGEIYNHCIGVPFSFIVNAEHATAPYTYTWSDSNIVANANEATIVPAVADQFVSQSFTYTVTVTDMNGCTATAETSVLVNAYPNFTVEGDTICFGETATVSATPVAEDADYMFTLTNGAFSVNFANGANQFDLAGLAAGVNEFSIAATDNVTGCQYTNPTTVSVLVYALPEFTIDAVVNRTSCTETNGSIAFTATTPNTEVYMNGEVVSSPVQNLDFGTYIFHAVDTETGCVSSIIDTVVVEDDRYQLEISNTISQTEFCFDDTTDVVMDVTLNTANAVYYYTFGETVTESTNPSFTYTIEQPGTYVVSVYAKDTISNCESPVLYDTINANPYPQNPTLMTNLETNETCSDVDIVLTASADLPFGEIVSYEFVGMDDVDGNTVTTTIPASYVDTTYTYNVIMTTDAGCTATASVSVTAFALPQITSISQDNYCPLQPTTVLPVVTGGAVPYIYEWSLSNDFEPASTDGSDIDGDILVDDASFVVTNGDCESEQEVTLILTDANGCEARMTQSIYAIDTTAPAFIFVPADTTFACEDYNEEVLAAMATPTYSDNCSAVDAITIETEVQTVVSADCPNNYVVTRTWTIADICGNEATVSQTITVSDVTAPVVVAETVPSNVTINCDEAAPVVDANTVSFTDNCSEYTVAFNAVSTQVNDENVAGHYNYTITRTWTATDACGNVSETQTQVVTVQDVDAPVVDAETVPADVTVSCDDIPEAAVVSFTDACYVITDDDITFTEISTQNQDNTTEGYYNYTITRTWFATDVTGNVSDTIVQVITVQDTEAPTFVVPAAQTLCKNADGSYEELVTVDLMGEPTQLDDNCAVMLVVTHVDDYTNVGDATTDGYIIRTWTVADPSGNQTSLTQTINLTHVPVVTIVGSEGICYNGSEVLTAYIDGAAVGSFAWSTDENTQAITITAEGTYSVVGTLNGCSASASITVTEYEHPILTSTVPEIECEGETITLLASAVDAASNGVTGTWNVVAVPAGLNTVVEGQSSISVETAPLFDDTHFVIEFTDDAHNCTYHDTSDITIISSDPFIRTYDENKVETNHVAVNAGEVLTYYIKVFKCSYAEDTRTTLEYDWNVLNGEDYEAATAMLNTYLNTINHNVNYSLDIQNPHTVFYMNNEYVNNASVSTFPYATSNSQPGTGFTPNHGNAYFNWFYLHFFNDRFIKVVVDRFETEGEFRVDYQLVTRNSQSGQPAGSQGSVAYIGTNLVGGMNFDQPNTTTIPLTGVKMFYITVNPATEQSEPEVIAPAVQAFNADVTLFPNPVKSESVKLDFENVEGQTIVRLVTLNGKVISEQRFNVVNNSSEIYQLPIDNYAPGIYFVQVVNGETVLSKKLIISSK